MRDPSVPASCMKLKMPEMFLLAEPRKGERRTKIQVFFAGIFFLWFSVCARKTPTWMWSPGLSSERVGAISSWPLMCSG